LHGLLSTEIGIPGRKGSESFRRSPAQHRPLVGLGRHMAQGLAPTFVQATVYVLEPAGWGELPISRFSSDEQNGGLSMNSPLVAPTNLHTGTTPGTYTNEAFRDKTVGLVSLSRCLTGACQSRIVFLLCGPDRPTLTALMGSVAAGSSAPSARSLGSCSNSDSDMESGLPNALADEGAPHGADA
jgi:hypothetical protein